MATIIREARPQDESRWRELWGWYLDFYGIVMDTGVTDATWRRVFDPSSSIFMRVAEIDGTIAGFALCVTHEGTWTQSPDCYLEDLFVDERRRGQGVGRALIDDLITLSKRNGWGRLYWHTEETNAAARRLYDRYVESDGHIRYRLKF